MINCWCKEGELVHSSTYTQGYYRPKVGTKMTATGTTQHVRNHKLPRVSLLSWVGWVVGTQCILYIVVSAREATSIKDPQVFSHTKCFH